MSKDRESVTTNGRAAFYACMWDDMTRQQQIYVLNAFTQVNSLFRRFLKEE